ncbi:MAG: peptidoglycan-binding protein [Cyanobacteria bacterium SBLK]|nr:peptidoglycan-binding protein [Cyanobacteria bacterium SBLK]
MIKPLIFGVTIGVIGMANGSIALAFEGLSIPYPQEYLYAQTEILRRGDRGEAVRELQGLLKAIGVFNGSISGFYDEATEAAVRRFQRDRGLIEDGIAGVQTRAAISAVARSQTRRDPPQNVPPSSSPALPIFTLGSQGNAVGQIQQRLQILGYFPYPLTGVYDERTRDAVVKFQGDRDLETDGIVGAQTIVALERSLSPQQIRDLQQRLQQAGFYNGAIDGVWGRSTQEAIEAARSRYGVNAADIVRGNN